MMLNNFILYLVLTIVYLLAFESITASASVYVNQTVYLSSPRTAFGSIQVKNKIYFAGGFGYHDYIASNVVDVLDLSNNNISQLTIGTARGMITPVVIEPYIYFIGGFSYLNVPFKLDAGSFTLSSNSLTSGPTVRRPTKLALYGSTLTVIGAYSVDFMNIQTGLWTTNPQLTAKMLTRYSTRTFAHLNYVFVFGGYDMKTDVWSNSVWVLDSPSNEPIEFVNQAPEQPIISSTLDEANRAVVFQYSDMVMVYHMSDQQWYTRDISGYVTSLSFFDSTIVCASNGYWTFEWTSTSITWTPVTDLTLAFAIGDQFVYTARDGSGVWNLFINVHGNPSPISSPTSDLQAEVISLVTKLSDTVLVFVTQRGSVFKYDSGVQEYARYSILASQPLYLLRVDNTTFVLVSSIGTLTSSTIYILDANIVTVVNSKDFDFTPMAFLNGQLIDIFTGKRVDLSWNSATLLGSLIPISSVWAQDGSNFYVMATSRLDGTPTFLQSLSTRVDVYNYEEEKWEPPLTADGALAQQGYYPAAVFNDTIVFTRNANVVMYNRQSGWTSKEIPELRTVLQDLQTFAPVPFVNDMAYFAYPGSKLNVITLPPNLEISNYEVSAANTKYIVANQSKMLFVATTVPTLNLIYATIITYDIEANQYDSTIIPNPVPDASLVVYDDFLLVFGANSSAIDYFYPSNFGWATESFDNTYLPTVLQTLKVDAPSTSSNSSTLLMIAGGRHRERYYYSDMVQFMTLNLTIPVVPVTAPVTTPSTQEPVASPATEDNSTTIIIAVVVPVGVVVIAGVLLAVLLTLRNKRRKNKMTTTSELEARYGQWFTPFHEIQFGDQLGQGANGQVFEGTWKNSKVALKVSPTQANASVISELEVMMKMRPHPNVIQLFGFSVHPETGSVILILEFCNGGALDAVLYDSHKPITTQQKMAWIIGAAQGLSHLHSNNIIHRDVAARNILLHQNEPKLIDFGMSRFVEEDQKGTTRSELGPIRWMSPESLRSKQYSNKSDVWSFGVLMYEIMAQEEPHSTSDPIDIARRIRDQGLTPTVPPSCPQKIASIMKECWNIDPNLRPTMECIVEELERAKNSV